MLYVSGVGRGARIAAAVAAALHLLPAVAAVPDVISITLTRNPDGSYSPEFRQGNKPPDPPTLDCTNPGTAELTGLLNGAGTYSENVRDDFTGTGAAACTLALVSVSGDDAATNGWAISGDNLTNPRTTNGSGSLRVTCTSAGDTRNCPVRAWSVVTPPATDSVAPTVPLGLEAVAGTNQVTFTWDPSHDPAPDASGVLNYDFIVNGLVNSTVTAAAGISPAFSTAQIGGADGSPSSTPTGASVDLSFGGAGIDGVADGLMLYGASVTGDQLVSGTVSACASVADFEKCGVTVRDGGNQDSPFVAIYYQGNGKVQAKVRTAAGVAASTVATQAATLPLSVKVGRSGSTFTAQYSSAGGAWQALGTADVAMAPTVTAGAFITSGAAGTNATGTVGNLTVSTAARLSKTHSTTSAVNVQVRARDDDGNVSATSTTVVGTPNVSAAPQLRWAPGHYLRFSPSESLANILSGMDADYTTTNLEGWMVPRYWIDLEPSEGSYNIGPSSTIGQAVARATLRGKKVYIRLQDKRFGTTSGTSTLPAYLRNMGCEYSRTTPQLTVGAALWRSECMDRAIALFRALADEYGDNVTVVGLSAQESVYGPNVGADYSATAVVQQEIRRMENLRDYEPRLQFLWMTNWISGDTAAKARMLEWMAACRAKPGCLITGGPDALVNGSGSSGTSDGWNAQIGSIGPVDHRGAYPIWSNTDVDDWNRGGTPTTVFSKMHGTGETNMMTWLRGGGGSVTTAAIKAFIAANPITHTTCPSAVTQGCSTE